jgi:hypothetical protein
MLCVIPTMDDLIAECSGLGVRVEWATLPPEMDGAYMLTRRTIILSDDLADYQQRPALAHEIEHAKRGDNGPQPPRVEQHIDEIVACRFVSLPAYAAAEEEHGWQTGAIACDLDLPRWVVRAYRRALTRAVEDALASA